MEALLSFKMTQWPCYYIGESFVIGWGKEIHGHVTAKDSQNVTTKDYTNSIRTLLLDDCSIIQKIQYVQ